MLNNYPLADNSSELLPYAMPSICIHLIHLQATQVKRMKLDDCKTRLASDLVDWKLVEDREAIYKEFTFKDFNEVSIYIVCYRYILFKLHLDMTKDF